ncbi:Plexin repeat family protein [Histomonas meleagridis]|uniref:Plexin repeat family protein n=1 Tax=Histomonas meleagridis TaxID=135588 RepID=UPI00355A381A|nr:Plexin repeat family protein [Histomonas meleagridis]KAH0805470.1 Plexin repeat family protein [Histomonas meleagridis]
MWFFALFSFASSIITVEEYCMALNGTDCMNCISQAEDANFSCGWCNDNQACLPGDFAGPYGSNCVLWIPNGTTQCKDLSSLSFPTTTKIIVGVCVGIIAVAALVFWVWIFPRLFQPNPDKTVVSVEF